MLISNYTPGEQASQMGAVGVGGCSGANQGAKERPGGYLWYVMRQADTH